MDLTLDIAVCRQEAPYQTGGEVLISKEDREEFSTSINDSEEESEKEE